MTDHRDPRILPFAYKPGPKPKPPAPVTPPKRQGALRIRVVVDRAGEDRPDD